MKISAALIMKNEEKNLPRLLDSLQGKFDEIVAVDTGSTDKSIEIAKKYGCKVYQKEWRGFADARNYAVSKCSGEWIWHFDADFELEDEEFKKFYLFIRQNKNLPYTAFNIYVKNYGLNGQILSISSQTFIHKNIPQIRWIGDIHERIDVKEVYALPVFVNHYGYQKTNVQIQKAKRNLKLLEREMKKLQDPKEKFLKYFYFLQTYAILAYTDEKYNDMLIETAKKFIDIFDKKTMNANFFSYGMTYIVEAYMRKKEYKNALCTINKALRIWNFHPDYIYRKAEILYEAQKYSLAKKYYLKFFEKAYEFQPGKNMAQVQVSESVNKIEQVIEKILDIFEDDEIEELYKNWKKEKNIYKIYLILRYFEKKGDKRFVKFFQKIAKVYANNDFLQRYFIVFYYNHKEYSKALSIAQKYLQKNPHDRVVNEVVAMIHFEDKNFPEARKYFEKTLLDNCNIEIFPLYVKTLEELGEKVLVKKLQKS